ncbi:TPA: hypothetical protein ACH3X1_001008 [Trebouxia sp. C0004]
MACQVGLHAPAHSGAETALSGAGAVIQDDGVAVDSPASSVAAGSQASVGPAGEPHLTQAAASAVYANSTLVANDSALSVADVSGWNLKNHDTNAASTLTLMNAQLDSPSFDTQTLAAGNKLTVAGAQQKGGKSNTRSHSSSPDAQAARFLPQTSSELANQQQVLLPALQQEAFAASAAAAVMTQSPYPHCTLASVQHGASAAASVEAVQQGGEDEDVQGGMATASTQAAGDSTSLPAISRSRRQRLYHDIKLPIAPSLRQQSPASNKATSALPIERGHSVVYDSECRLATKSPVSQHQFGLSAAASGRKRHRTENDIAGPSHAAHTLLSPECSEASQGHPHTAQHTEACQAAPANTQQATIQEAMSGQQFDEEAQQSAYKSISDSKGHADTSPSTSVGIGTASLDLMASVAAEPLYAAAAAHPSTSADTSADGLPHNVQQQTTASNDALVAGGSTDMQQHAAASVHATVSEEDCPASDAETDLSSVGLLSGRRQHDKGDH